MKFPDTVRYTLRMLRKVANMKEGKPDTWEQKKKIHYKTLGLPVQSKTTKNHLNSKSGGEMTGFFFEGRDFQKKRKVKVLQIKDIR